MGDCHRRRNNNLDASAGLEICLIAASSRVNTLLLRLLVVMFENAVLLVDDALSSRDVLLPPIDFVLANVEADDGVRCT